MRSKCRYKYVDVFTNILALKTTFDDKMRKFTIRSFFWLFTWSLFGVKMDEIKVEIWLYIFSYIFDLKTTLAEKMWNSQLAQFLFKYFEYDLTVLR